MLQLTIWTKNDCKCIFDTKYCYQNDLRSKIIFSFFRFFQKILMYRVKNFEKKIFLKFWFLVTWSILWLNSSSKTKFQLNRVTRRELGAILHSISWFVLYQLRNWKYLNNTQIPEIYLWYWCVDWNANRFDIDQGKYSLHFEIWISYISSVELRYKVQERQHFYFCNHTLGFRSLWCLITIKNSSPELPP